MERRAFKAPDRETAIKLQRAKRVEFDQGEAVAGSRFLTVGAYLLDWWPKHCQRKQLRPSAVYTGDVIIRKRLIPALGPKRLDKLDERAIDTAVHHWQQHGYKPRTIKNTLTILNEACHHARRMRLIGRNPVTDVDRPAIRAKQEPQWTPEQARTFLDALARERYRALYVLALATGLRRAELLGLRWSDLDLDAGVLYVRQAIVDVNGKLTPGEPKTDAGERDARLEPPVVQLLHEHRAKQLRERLRARSRWEGAGDRGELVFSTPLGKPMHPSSVYRALQRIIKRNGLPPIGLHGLRRTWSSIAHDGTRDILAVAKAAGHAHPETTVRHYARANDDAAARVATAVAKTLFGT
jgi:integrase